FFGGPSSRSSVSSTTTPNNIRIFPASLNLNSLQRISRTSLSVIGRTLVSFSASVTQFETRVVCRDAQGFRVRLAFFHRLCGSVPRRYPVWVRSVLPKHLNISGGELVAVDFRCKQFRCSTFTFCGPIEGVDRCIERERVIPIWSGLNHHQVPA